MSVRSANWLNFRPVLPLKRINKTITIPAFSQQCFFEKNYIRLTTMQLARVTAITSNVSFAASPLTVEFWIKDLSVTGSERFVIEYHRLVENSLQWAVELFDSNLAFLAMQSAVINSSVSSATIQPGEWNHVAITYDGTNTLKFYVNGELIDTNTDITGGFDAGTGNNYGLVIGSKDDLSLNFLGDIAEIRTWNVVRTQEQIQYSMDKFRNIIPADTIDDDLQHYFSCRDHNTVGVNTYIYDDLDNTLYFTLDNTKTLLLDDEPPPMKLGASFAPLIFNVSADVVHSLVFPVEGAPVNPNFGLAVAWIDDSGNTQRRSLFMPDAVDIWPRPNAYAGETLPVTYNLEIWNIDGEFSVDLATALNIKTSVTTNPTSDVDFTPTALSVPVKDSTLAENFPLTDFPLEFNTTQTY